MKKEKNNPSPNKDYKPGEWEPGQPGNASDKMHPKNPLLAEMPFPQSEYGKKDEPLSGSYQVRTDEFNVPERIYADVTYRYSDQARPKPSFRTPYNYQPYLGKHNSQPSLTVPNQSMTVDEILRRHTLGLPMTGQKVELWEGDEQIMPDLQGLDLSEIQELKEQALQKITDIRTRYAKEQDKQKREKLLHELKKEIDEAKAKENQAPDQDKNSSNK